MVGVYGVLAPGNRCMAVDSNRIFLCDYGRVGHNRMIKYIIQNLVHSSDTIKFINQDTTSLEDIWTTMWPKKKENTGEYYRPMLFHTKKEAKRYLTQIKRQSREDWAKNSHIYRFYGFRKPEWDIYETFYRSEK